MYLIHMLDIARLIARKTEKHTHDQFLTDDDIQLISATLLQRIGEAAGRVTEKRRHELPGIPSKQMTGMRHRLVHDYMSVNYEVVWQTLQDDLPMVIAELARYVNPIVKLRRKKS
jgi:uncharacterized protein with HEPN domain